ncbi:hypothetical protein IFM89_006615 [Coptis chinensis]|uniref:Uncharacterized protein n=1 Tax=Coptis chinensis TaxID=261450 RepID=A0A835M780_9MAGN|nr:hypothetical protein IFM89_006615 [Coptis chinensis]
MQFSQYSTTPMNRWNKVDKQYHTNECDASSEKMLDFFVFILNWPARNQWEHLTLSRINLKGKMSQSCISMALYDYYSIRNYTRKLVLHTRDSNSDIVGAASAGLACNQKI